VTCIDRYIFAVFFRTLLVCFLSFGGIFVIFHAFTNMDDLNQYAERGGGIFRAMVHFYGPYMFLLFELTGAIVTLVAMLFTIGLLRRSGELTAILSAGVGHGRIVRPMMWGVVMMLAMSVINRELLLPRWQDQLGMKVRFGEGENSERQVLPVYDRISGILINGRAIRLGDEEILNPSFKLHSPVPGFGNQIHAASAAWMPATTAHPAGYLLRGVESPSDIDSLASVEIADGMRQLITNQEEIFNKGFFSTVQLLLAGSDSQGLRYGTTGTPEQFFVEWKDEAPAGAALTAGALLDRPLAQMCNKARLLDLIRNFVIFDAGQKKVPRPHQYFAVKAAQARIATREGGVIWHTQGSGKSIVMVFIAKWLLEHDPEARILVVTDRDELDKQIEGVMKNAGVVGPESLSPRITSRAEFVEKLGATTPRLLCALIHKFDPADLKGPPPPVQGRIYVFVDECHRTQGGDMNKQMKHWLEGAIFIGFTATPLLRKDKQLTRDVFGTYIHTYKFHEGVADGVILDLKYEARDVPQRLTSQAAIDQWFEQKTRGLNNFQKAVLRKRWATMEELMSLTLHSPLI